MWNNIGKPIPQERKQNAYDWLKSDEMKFDTLSAHSVVESVAAHLERDKPYEAQQRAMLDIDLTGTYRLMAILLTDAK